MWMSQFLRREIAAAVWAAATCVSWPCACACACASTSASAIMSPIWNEAKRSRIGERMGSETRQLQDFLRWMNGAARCGGGDPEGCGGMEKDEKKERDGRTRTELESCWAGGTTTHATVVFSRGATRTVSSTTAFKCVVRCGVLPYCVCVVARAMPMLQQFAIRRLQFPDRCSPFTRSKSSVEKIRRGKAKQSNAEQRALVQWMATAYCTAAW